MQFFPTTFYNNTKPTTVPEPQTPQFLQCLLSLNWRPFVKGLRWLGKFDLNLLLYISGFHLSRPYVSRPRNTSELFVVLGPWTDRHAMRITCWDPKWSRGHFSGACKLKAPGLLKNKILHEHTDFLLHPRLKAYNTSWVSALLPQICFPRNIFAKSNKMEIWVFHYIFSDPGVANVFTIGPL